MVASCSIRPLACTGRIYAMQIPTQRATVFVDGSNMLVEMFRLLGIDARAEKATATAFNAAMHAINVAISGLTGSVAPVHVLRRYWFGSVLGSPLDLANAQEALRRSGFDGILFQNHQERK